MNRHLFDHWLRIAEEAAQLPKLGGGLWHPYRRKWSIERKHHPLVDVAAAGGWRDTATLIECYSQADPETLLSVTSEPRKFGGNGFTSEPMSNLRDTAASDQERRGSMEGPRS